MAGCSVLLLFPVLLVGAALRIALPIHAVFSGCAALALIVVRVNLNRRGFFVRYSADQTWRKPATITLKWALRLATVYFLAAAISSTALWFYYFAQ